MKEVIIPPGPFGSSPRLASGDHKSFGGGEFFARPDGDSTLIRADFSARLEVGPST